MKDRLLYILAMGVIKGIQALPLPLVGRIGRALGGMAYRLDARHRRVAISNLTAAFGSEWDSDKIHSVAREHFRRLGENYCGAIKTAAMSDDQIKPHLEVTGLERLEGAAPSGQSRMFAIGHFGNFEIYARGKYLVPGYQMVTTFRALKQKSLNKILIALRKRSGVAMLDRKREADALRKMVRSQPVVLGLLSDQHAGRGGAWIPFFGRPCSTTKSTALYALRFKLPLLAAICYRTSLVHWRIEVSPVIPTFDNGRPRSPEDIMTDVNKVFEEAVRRDPANWFWVHQRWKPFKPPKRNRPAPAPR